MPKAALYRLKYGSYPSNNLFVLLQFSSQVGLKHASHLLPAQILHRFPSVLLSAQKVQNPYRFVGELWPWQALPHHHLLWRSHYLSFWCMAFVISFVKATKSSTDNRSARSSYNGLSLILSFGTTADRAFRNVLRLWLKAAFTTRQNSFSSQSSVLRSFLVIFITPESTLGGGLNAPAFTVKRYCTS